MTNEVNEMKGVFGKTTLNQLPVVVAVDKELNILHQGSHSSCEASGFASESFQKVA